MSSTDLQFDAEKHIYTLNGRQLVSVTQSLVLGGLVDPTWFTDFGRDRGTAVHEAVLYDVQADLDRASVHPAIRGYVDGWFRFLIESRFKPIPKFCERRQFHPLHFYAGTLDLWGLLNARHVIIDVKTGDASTAGYQTAAYSKFPAFMAYNPDRYSLRLYPDGRYKLNKHDDPNDWLVFLNNLERIRKEGLTAW